MSVKTGVTVVVLGLAAIVPAVAQTAAPDPANGMRDAPSESLSTKLSKSGGVITPKPGVDPGMKVPAPVPQPNTTPVIPPSATGGNSAK